MRPFFILLLGLPFTASLNILMYVNVIGKSHLQFAEKLIAQLNERGHQVDVILGMINQIVTLKGTYGARKLVSVHFPGERATHLLDPFTEPSDWERLKIEHHKFTDTALLLCDLILDSPEVAILLSSNQYDVALLNAYDFCPFSLAHYHKISPVVSYVPTASYYHQHYYAGLPELPLYENTLFDARHEDRSYFATRVYETLRTFKERWIHYTSYAPFNEKLRVRFGDNFPDVREIAMNTSLDFSNSHPLLEEPKPISLRLRYIGGIALPTPKPLTKELDTLLNVSAKGTVVFSFGTQIQPDKITEDLRAVFINTFKRFPEYTFLWKLDGKTQFNTSNVINMDWLPQTDLLYDSRVVAFISHMGLNSFTETSFAGVPVVAVPVFTDQVHNAKRAKALGTAVIVRKTEITEESLSRALEKVLFDDRYRKRAREVASMIVAMPDTPQRIFFEGIEYAAKFKNLPVHYRLVGAKHNFLVQIGWDVAAFLALSSLFISHLALKVVVFAVGNTIAIVRRKQKLD
ncbi:hypothetical protein PRIPAC_80021 [Pristionchus pacificus]|uniref:glucuronosyltransferase n=1 Tax=Pristionchus pacificus TaxID=54126 RepID=A0A2A6CLX4_PRIPA|nr:hypothetical protein PRIPAC_80021 [Pristionchus pacificus]|eukprot:PDM79109.1 Glycosyltransferase [Pristionchus pacificus]